MLIVSAFALLTLPGLMSASASPAPVPPPVVAVRYDCLSEFLSCMANTGGDPDCLTQYLDCL